MDLEQKLKEINEALWCFDFEHIMPSKNDPQRYYLFCLKILFKGAEKRWESKNIIERFKARKSLISLTELWDKTVKTSIATNGRTHPTTVIEKITLPPEKEQEKIGTLAKIEYETYLQDMLSQRKGGYALKHTLNEMHCALKKYDFENNPPAPNDERKTYLYSIYLLLQKNETSLSSAERVERLHAQKNLIILTSLWESTVSTFGMFRPNGNGVVIIENVKIPEQEHFEKIVETARSYKTSQKSPTDSNTSDKSKK